MCVQFCHMSPSSFKTKSPVPCRVVLIPLSLTGPGPTCRPHSAFVRLRPPGVTPESLSHKAVPFTSDAKACLRRRFGFGGALVVQSRVLKLVFRNTFVVFRNFFRGILKLFRCVLLTFVRVEWGDGGESIYIYYIHNCVKS